MGTVTDIFDAGLEKLVDSASFFEDNDPAVMIIDLDHSEELIKKAADAAIAKFVEDELAPKATKMYLHINAMGAGEFYGANKNGDYFPEEQLIRYHKTFEQHGHVFRHHINKDPAKAIGKVIFSTYNLRMHRIELIVEVCKSLGADVEAGIISGKFPFTSMACKTPFDVCSVCGNKAHTRQQYCSHLNTELGKMLPNGKKVMAMNLGPLRFFDISIVIRPADITSSVLDKVANAQAATSSIDMAEVEGTPFHQKKASTVKSAAFKKMSELIKKVEGTVVDTDTSLQDILYKVRDPELDLVPTLAKFPIDETLNAFAELGMAPSIRFLAELLAYEKIGTQAKGLGEKAELALFTSDLTDIPEAALDYLPEIDEKKANPIITNLISRYSDSSMFPQEVEKRASKYYEGYLGTGTGENLPRFVMMSKDDIELRRQKIVAEETKTGLLDMGPLKALLALGGAALLTRYYVSALMDKKIENTVVNHMNSPYHKQQAKISFEKTAQVASKMIDNSTVLFFELAKTKGY